jgi:hypothetical protein
MRFVIQQQSITLLLSLGSATMLFAEQRGKLADVEVFQNQAVMEMQTLQEQMEKVARENRHIVREPSVNALEVRRADEKADQAAAQASAGQRNPRSPEERAKLQLALQEFNEQLPEINRALKQASSNNVMVMAELKPMTAEKVLAASEAEGPSVSTGQMAGSQIITKRLQQEMAKADPETRRQIKGFLEMMTAGDEAKPPRPRNLPPARQSQLFPKGAP